MRYEGVVYIDALNQIWYIDLYIWLPHISLWLINCNTLQHTATHLYIRLPHISMRCSIESCHGRTCDMTHSYLQHIAVCIKFTRGGHTPTLCVPPVCMNSVTWLQRVAVCCIVCCSVWWCFSHKGGAPPHSVSHLCKQVMSHSCSVLQCVAVCCSV